MNGRAIPGAYLFRLYVCDNEMSWPHHIGETHQPDWVVYVRDSEMFRLTNVIPERIIFASRGITVHYSWWTTHTTVLTNKNLGTLYKKLNKTYLIKLCLSAIQTVIAFITCSSTPKALKWTPRKTNIWKWCKLFLSSGTVFREVTKEKGSGLCRI